MTSRQKAILILGMHRSGTSVLAGCLHHLGINLGQHLMPPGQFNPSGYYENQDVMLIHDILLRDLGCRWDMIGSLPEDWHKSKAAENAREKIINLIERDFSKDNLWSIKDPRLCRLLPLWLDIFQEKGIEPSFVLMIRHPYEVANSLQKRDNLDLLKAHLLWLTHIKEAVSYCQDRNHLFLTYDQLLADPLSCLKSISKNFEIAFPQSLEQNYQQVINFVRPELKHFSINGKGQKQFAPYSWLYDQLRLYQIKALNQGTSFDSSTKEQAKLGQPSLEIRNFPLMDKSENHHKPESSHASEMFDNLLSIISHYEQAELDRNIQRQRRLITADQQSETLYAQVFFPTDQDQETFYTEDSSQKILLAPLEWQQINLDLTQPETLRQKSLRFDPLNTKGIIRVSAINLIDAASQEVAWSISETTGFKTCQFKNDILILDTEKSLLICSTGNDPQIYLPPIPDLPDRPMQLEVWIKVNRSLDQLIKIWQEREQVLQDKSSQLKKLREDQKQSQAEWAKAKEQLKELNQELQKSKEKIHSLEHDKNQYKKQRQEELEAWQEAKQSWENKIQEQEKLIQDYQNELTQSKKAHERLRTDLEQLENQWQEETKAWQEAKQSWENKIQEQEKLIQDYQNELTQSEKDNDKLRIEREQADSDLKKVKNDLAEQKQKVQELENSLASQEDLTREYFSELAKAEQQLVKFEEQSITSEKLINQLNNDFQALLSSARWRTGNRLVRLLEILLFRKKQPLATDHIQNIFKQLETEKRTEKYSDLHGYKPFYQTYDTKTFNSWLRQLSNDFQALKSSKRWKLGNAIIRGLEIVTFKSRQAMATDHLEKIFQDFQTSSDKYAVQDTITLESWLRQAKNDLQALECSKRWQVGNKIFSTIDTLFLRGKKPTAMNHAQKIIAEYEKYGI